jgi:DNA-binding NarL/FixJ family response regulator
MVDEAKIRVLLADDHQLFREGLKRILLMENERIDVIGECADGGEAVALAEKLKPDVILMDINMPVLNGVGALKAIQSKNDEAKVVILSIHDHEGYISETLSSGASGYLLKDMEAEDLVEAIEVVSKGGAYVHPKVLGKVLMEFRRLHEERHADPLNIFTGKGALIDEAERVSLFSQLTKRETEVLRLLVEGNSNRAIAQRLYISEKTVKNHMSSILQKLNVDDRTQAVILAIRYGVFN